MKKRYLYIDCLRLFSMLSVIFLHIVADILRNDCHTLLWGFSNIFTSLLSVSVPVFFMISGALLMSSEESLSVKSLYVKRLKKIGVPFLFWSIVALFYFLITEYVFQGNLNIYAFIKRLKNITGHPVTIHFWFMYALIPIYIITPFIKILIDNMKKEHIRYFIMIWFIFSIVFNTLNSFLSDNYSMIFTMDLRYSLNFFNGYLGFFILGYYIHTIDFKIKSKNLFLIIISDLLIITIGTYYMTDKTGNYFECFKYYNSIFTAILSVSVFLLFKKIFSDKESNNKGLILLSDLSFAVYLIHNLIIHFMDKTEFLVTNTISGVFIRFIFVFIVSFTIIYLLKSIKITCFISTGLRYKKRIDKNEKN